MTTAVAARPPVTARPSHAPLDFETDLGPLPLHGALPAGLVGALVRNGPNPLVPDPQAHWFTGDGMLHAFYLGTDGQVRYRNRWVRTSRFLAEQASGRGGSGRLGAPHERDDGVANTHIVAHAGRMLALEEAHLPVEMELATLATRGGTDLGGGLHGPFTAHPKTDPRTGELLFFGYGTPAPLSAGMSFGIVSPRGEVTRFERFEAPYASMAHDFLVSEGHVLFPVMPLTGSMPRAQRGGPPYAWEPELGTRVGIMPRHGSTQDIVWWRGPACYVFHFMNAWEADGRLYADGMQYDAPPLFPRADGQSAADDRAPARLVRWTFDLAGAAAGSAPHVFTQTLLEPVAGEFPRIDERFTGRPYRHGWIATHLQHGAELHMLGALMHLDHARTERDTYAFDAGDRVSEPVFVPRAPDAPEGEGWLLAVVWRSAEDRSDLVIFDAQALARGPVCTAELPHRVPAGFHGSWFPAGFPGAVR